MRRADGVYVATKGVLLPRTTESLFLVGQRTNLVVENFHAATGLVEKPENLVLDVKQLLLICGNACDKVVVTLLELGLFQRDHLQAKSGAGEWRVPKQSAPTFYVRCSA